MTSHHTAEKEPTSERNASGFTAVNGRELQSSGSAGRTDVVTKPGNDPIDRRGKHLGSQSTSRQHSPRPGPDVPIRDRSNGNRQYSSSQELDTPASSPGKRKRSSTDDGNGSSGSSHYDLSPPRRASGSSAGVTDARVQRAQESDRSEGPYTNSSKAVDSQTTRGHDHHWQSGRKVPPGYQTNGSGRHVETSDAQLADALQRETQAPNSHRTWSVGGQPDEDSADQYGTYGSDRTPQGAVQAGPKRKRVFSNRTKTGCMTCRKRKKKCDEGQPYCNNCMRGGFTCEGYNSRTTWQKQSNAKGPVPLQSKDGYAEGSDHTYSAESHSPGAKRESLLFEAGHQAQPIMPEDGEHSQRPYTTSPTSAGTRQRGSFSQPWVRNQSYVPEQSRQDLPPFSEIAREQGKQPYAVPPMRDSYPRPHSTSQQSSGSWHPAMVEYMKKYPPSGPVDPRSLQGVAREGLSMEEVGRSLIKGDELQKEKMLSGQPFKYNDPLLIEDRKRCKMALRQFHEAENPTLGVGEMERARKLREIFSPIRNPVDSVPYPSKWEPTGAVGPGSVVETPFRCQYGYNIRLGEDVYIGENCTIVDSCTVSIGAKTWIGQNVTIITAMAHTSMNMRAGSAASWQGKAVTIAEDVHIGAGAIIYPGVTIKRGAQVEPGAVVKKDVEAYAQGATLEFMM